jgi:hypothetical protein
MSRWDGESGYGGLGRAKGKRRRAKGEWHGWKGGRLRLTVEMSEGPVLARGDGAEGAEKSRRSRSGRGGCNGVRKRGRRRGEGGEEGAEDFCPPLEHRPSR